MKSRNRFASIFLAIILSTVLGCASTSTKEGTGEYVDDSVITSKVKAAIFNEPSLSSNQIGVETFKGKVQLSGFVKSQSEINKAGDIARNVKGVEVVANDLRLR